MPNGLLHTLISDEFPSPEDWDNEEYTGSLADTKVFTPSTAVEPETVETIPPIEDELKDESVQLQMSMQSPPNVNTLCRLYSLQCYV